MKLATYFIAAVLFAAGLVVSGMTQPSKVIGFLDFFGDWDPSLAMVMGGAIAAHFPAYRLIMRRASPWFADAFRVPKPGVIDNRLVAGSALFGVGWGIAGYCPGPALTSLVALEPNTFLFVGSMLFAMFLFAKTSKKAP